MVIYLLSKSKSDTNFVRFPLGLFTALFLTTTYILIYRRKHRPLNMPILAVSILMYIIATVVCDEMYSDHLILLTFLLQHVIVATVRTYDGFISHRIDPGPAPYFLIRANFAFLFKTSLYIAQTSIGDAFMVCLLLWSKDSLWLTRLVLEYRFIVCGSCILQTSDLSFPL